MMHRCVAVCVLLGFCVAGGVFCVSAQVGPACSESVYVPGECPGASVFRSECQCARATWSCPAGYFCPTPGHALPCNPGFYCPANVAQAVHCCKGHYCPSPTTMVVCPQGSFCRPGQKEPIGCPLIASCPKGTSEPQKYGVEVTIAVLIVLFFLAVLIRKLVMPSIIRTVSSRNLKSREGGDSNQAQGQAQGSAEDDGSAKVGLVDADETEQDSSAHRGRVIEYDGISFETPDGLKVLNGLSGRIVPGRLTALMGPSGAGKTTLLHVISGKERITSGTLLCDGVQLTKEAQLWRTFGFVPQQDTMISELTVYDNVYFSAVFRSPKGSLRRKIVEKVNEVLKSLQIAHRTKSLVGDEEKKVISGGEKKRVSIGMELVAGPSVLFLDEPTSGLDSSASVKLVHLLKERVHSDGLTCVAVVHQPRFEVFNMFDDLVLLAPGGYMAFNGPVSKLSAYLEHLGFRCDGRNVADTALDALVSDKYTPLQWNALWKVIAPFFCEHPLSAEIPAAVSILQPSSTGTPDPTDRASPSATEDEQNNGLPGCLAWTSRTARLVQSNACSTFSDLWFDLKLFFVGPPSTLPPSQSWYIVFLGCLHRTVYQLWNQKKRLLEENFLHLVAGIVLGFSGQHQYFLGPVDTDVVALCPLELRKTCSSPVKDQLGYLGLFIVWGISFVGVTASTKTFGSEAVQYWRDASHGLNPIMYFLAKLVADFVFRMIPAAFVFSVGFCQFFSSPVSGPEMFGVILLIYLNAFSIGYLSSHVFDSRMSNMGGTTISLILAVAFGGVVKLLPESEGLTSVFCSISYPRWAIELFYLVVLEHYEDVASLSRILAVRGYEMTDIPMCRGLLFLLAVMQYFLSFLVMILTHRKQKR
eukprot:ANDGO_06238.mRNA.1 Putative white-brown complex homolog protein 30